MEDTHGAVARESSGARQIEKAKRVRGGQYSVTGLGCVPEPGSLRRVSARRLSGAVGRRVGLGLRSAENGDVSRATTGGEEQTVSARGCSRRPPKMQGTLCAP